MKQLKLAANSVTYTAILEAAYFFPPQFGSRFFQRGITQIPKGDFMRVGSTKERYLTKCPTVFHSHQREGNFFS
jgi:hypothetical protein